ncbi:MAG: hypothetical protein A2Y75_08940 [Candidatus Solincola sediminis]|uniref:Flippase-like domain-containing protein n=1 Tax=Candidatus Solincola sediminis TaxID=1797199 RepID=A0A1F2WF29_9ACTN|nr:MAG: hypothetical protein A2Y75_08940 [Candidatus Solincola sediminis]
MKMAKDIQINQSNAAAEAAPPRRQWHMIRDIIILLLLGTGLYLLVPKFIGDREMLAVVKNANFLMIPVALAIETLSMLSICRLYYEVMKSGGGSLSFPRLSLIYMSAYAFGHVVPGGNAGTVYLNYREYRNEGVSRRLAAKTLVISNLAYSAGLIAMLVCGLLLTLATGRLPFSYNITAIVISSGSILFVLLCVYVLIRPDLLRRVAVALLHAIKAFHLLNAISDEEVESWVGDISDYVRSMFRDRRSLIRIGSCGIGFWFFDLACLYTVFVAIGHPINPGILMLSYTIADIVGSLPLTPAGLGVFEVSLGAILYGFGYPKEVLATAILGFRFFSFWLCTLAGGGCYLVLLTQRRKQKLGGEVRGNPGIGRRSSL